MLRSLVLIASLGQTSRLLLARIFICALLASSTSRLITSCRSWAASLAVSIIQKHCYTIQVKTPYLSDGTQVDLTDVQLNKEVGGRSEAIGGEC